MAIYILRRILQWIPVVLISSVVVFLITRALPGDPAQGMAGADASPEVIEALRQVYGLDKPLPVQYVLWLWHVLQGDFGTSYIYHHPNLNLILDRLPYSLLIAVCGMIIASSVAIPLGIYAAVNRGKFGDWMVSTATATAIAAPEFWFGIIAILIFAVTLGWLPAGGFVSFANDPLGFFLCLILPSVTLALNATAILARFTRSAILETLSEDYVRTAQAKGISRGQVLRRHVLRNSVIPIVTMIGIQLGRKLGGAVVIETLFAWPGVGRLLVQAIANRDYGLVQGILLLLILFFLIINLLVDLLYGALDPRIRIDGAKA